MTAANWLSVGELLLEGDLTARRLLLDPDALDAAAMVRTWPEVVQAGHEFLAILPRRGGGPGVHAMPGARSHDRTGERLQLMATSMHQHFSNRSWPGDGPADDQLLAIAGNLIRAHDMVASHRRPAPLLTPAVLADAAVARERILHTLYVASHAINVAVQAQLRATPRAGKSTPRIVSALRGAQQRLPTFEAVAGREFYRTFPTDPALEHREPPRTGDGCRRPCVLPLSPYAGWHYGDEIAGGRLARDCSPDLGSSARGMPTASHPRGAAVLTVSATR